MLFIKRLFSLFKKNNHSRNRNKQNHELISEDSMCAVNANLLYDGTVDLSIEMHNIDVNNTNFYKQANNIASFLHLLNTGGLSTNIANIMVTQIGSDPKYSLFIDQIIKSWVIYQTEHETHTQINHTNNAVIKPTDVFGKYYNK